MNLFLSTRRMADGCYEDHLTEFFAAALQMFPKLRRDFYELALAPYCQAKGWGTCEITGVETQASYEEEFCRPDMVLTLSNGKVLGCEHKLDALETMGPEADQRPQLERYLDLPIDGLLYIRASWKPPESAVLSHPNYVKPIDGEHFLWRDFYPLFSSSDESFLIWLKEGFERFGFTPPHPQIGELKTEADRRNFAKLWLKSRSYAHSLGWDSNAGAIVQIYLEDNANSSADVIFIQPTAGGFQFRATPKRKHRDACFASLSSASKAMTGVADHGVKLVRRKDGKVAVYDIEVPANVVLGDGELPAGESENRLYRFVAPLLDAVQLRTA